MDGSRAFRPSAGGLAGGDALANLVVVCLLAAGQGINQFHVGGLEAEARDRSTVVGPEDHREDGVPEENLVAPVGVEIANFAVRSVGGGLEPVEQDFRLDEMAKQRAAQVRRVNAAEDAVPISVVTLRGQEVSFRLADNGGAILGGRAVALFGFQPPADFEHEFVNLIRLGVFDQKILPNAAAKEPPLPPSTRCSFSFFDGEFQLPRRARRQRPLHHFLVGGCREVDPPHGWMAGEIRRDGGGLKPRGSAFDRCQEPLEPAVLVHMVVGARPDAELFAVVSHGEEARVQALSLAQNAQSFFGLAEGDSVAQGLQAGNQAKRGAGFFGDVNAVEL